MFIFAQQNNEVSKLPSKNKLDEYYMSLALRVAELSHGIRGKVGEGIL